MSDPRSDRSESDHPEGGLRESEGDRLVESLLKRLEPNPLECDLLKRLERERLSCAAPREMLVDPLDDPRREVPCSPEPPRPGRLVLLTLASLGALLAYLGAHFDLSTLHLSTSGPNSPAFANTGEAPPVAPDAASRFAEETVSPGDSIRVYDPSIDGLAMPASAPSAPPSGFLPVSRQGLLVERSHQGVVETEEGVQEQLRLEFRDAYHWHDPASGTNLRVYTPRSESVVVPLRTD